MESRRDFKDGDLVWAKMKNYPFWPGKIVSPPTGKEKKKSSKQKKQNVFFFGTENSAWITDENIVPHSEEMLNKVSKRKNMNLSKAIDEIIKENDKMEKIYLKIGFIGLTNNGQRIVQSLLSSGCNVSVWNQTPEFCEECVDAGARQFITPEELVLHCDIIFCLLSGPEAVKSIVLGNGGICQKVEECKIRGKGYVELSAIDRDTSLETAAEITGKGGKYLAAPLSGPFVDPISQELCCAGDVELYHSCRAYFRPMCSRASYKGLILTSFCK
ncbi:hypothetical protein TNIN_420781 [Trichonephila inaurata madagascariensis]|uniref:PWWP domain-containing protein n=1 Tax=Trichonephila inaurata madagascariensis TaxID=2747483 RepID=A0A8X6X191_9ARAC|nr:hypothetical protein TNIN_420781 [Trichonephila inaurata madagascariensis]